MPPKPRVQTPKKRATPKQAQAPDRQRLLLYALAGSGLLALVLVTVVLAVTGGDGGTNPERVAQAAAAADCGFSSGKAQPRSHSVTSPDGMAKWTTTPPTTGPHYEVPAVWGAYDSPLQPARVVHNLEHGGIFIQYGEQVRDATVRELRSFYEDHQGGTLLAPYPSLEDQIALGAWVTPSADRADDGTYYLMKCTRFAEAAFTAFFDEFHFKGPERFPADSLLPGT